jgi:single-strand DNA-binding protein
MNDISITVVGVVGSDVSFSPGENGARANFRLASTSRYFDQHTKEWKDGSTTWLDVVCWRKLAEHVNDSIEKGQPVIVTGRMRVRT